MWTHSYLHTLKFKEKTLCLIKKSLKSPKSTNIKFSTNAKLHEALSVRYLRSSIKRFK